MKVASTKREWDKSIILDVVRRFAPISRVAIHALTELRPGTISTLVRELIEEDRLREAGRSDNPTGRKQVLLRLNEDFGFVVAIEFDAEYVVAAVINLGAKIRHKLREPTRLDRGVDGLVKQLLDCSRRVIAEAGVPEESLVTICVADPGLIDSRAGVSITSSTIDFWVDVPLRDVFAKHFRAPFLMESNTRARTVAERILGAGHMADDMVYLEYGAGIGMGIVAEGRLLRGCGESAGEFGHTHVVEGGPPCKCGSFGCLEALVGAPAIASRVRNAVRKGGVSAALDLAGDDRAAITGFTVLKAAGQGDKMCTTVVHEMGRYLGLGLANIVNLFNPSLVVLDKRLALAGPGLLDQIKRLVNRQALHHSTDDLSFHFGELGADGGVLGVALLAIEDLFRIPDLKLPKFMTNPAIEKVATGD